ncbi:MAG: helix-hairpin-helix domain-containing protein, partial [Oscillospiraceae bacterium]|nr:helix-hairpin-helix domain-containing protein [Oscillospiraceae bacterium]
GGMDVKLRKTELWAVALTAAFLAVTAGYQLGRRETPAEVRVSAAALPAVYTETAALPERGAAADGAAGRIDINTATVEELKTLEGVGDVLAERIAADREMNGPFGSVEELRRVSGIGEKLLERNRERLTASGEEGGIHENSGG